MYKKCKKCGCKLEGMQVMTLCFVRCVNSYCELYEFMIFLNDKTDDFIDSVKPSDTLGQRSEDE